MLNCTEKLNLIVALGKSYGMLNTAIKYNLN